MNKEVTIEEYTNMKLLPFIEENNVNYILAGMAGCLKLEEELESNGFTKREDTFSIAKSYPIPYCVIYTKDDVNIALSHVPIFDDVSLCAEFVDIYPVTSFNIIVMHKNNIIQHIKVKR